LPAARDSNGRYHSFTACTEVGKPAIL
jgi:hypothetical protein